MRALIAAYIRSHSDQYNALVLGAESIDSYCNYIQQGNNWGGALELSMLSEFYKIQICAWDTQSCRMDTYGQDKEDQYQARIFLVYDGIHYDPLSLSLIEMQSSAKAGMADSPEAELDLTIFSVNDQYAVQKSAALVKMLQQQRKFTDLHGCTLMCGICNAGLKGQKEAQEHAQKTGHMNFSQVNQ